VGRWYSRLYLLLSFSYFVLAVLGIGIFQGDVRIKSSLFEIFVLSDRQGSVIDEFIGPDNVEDRLVEDIGSGVEKEVTDKTHCVPETGGSKDRPVDIKT
jgi:hypothetical protein